jgi:hypothetical protein
MSSMAALIFLGSRTGVKIFIHIGTWEASGIFYLGNIDNPSYVDPQWQTKTPIRFLPRYIAPGGYSFAPGFTASVERTRLQRRRWPERRSRNVMGLRKAPQASAVLDA